MRDTNLTHFSDTSMCGYNKISSIFFAFKMNAYIWLSSYLRQEFCVLSPFEPPKYVYPVEDSNFNLKLNYAG